MAEFSPELENSDLEQELEILKEIYYDELNVITNKRGKAEQLVLQLHPATGDDVHRQLVCLTLVLTLPSLYPDEIPLMEIRNPRGLTDEHISGLSTTLHEMASERKGGAMLYELIDHVKESLTEGNVPVVECVVCLEDLTDVEDITRTQCYHYLHSYCLLTYVEHSLNEITKQSENQAKHVLNQPKKEVLCPVCREPISYDLDTLKQAEPPPSDNLVYTPSPEMRELQAKMSKLFEKQKAKDGIIDLEKEKNKYLLPAELVIHLDNNTPPPNTAVPATNGLSHAQAKQRAEFKKGLEVTKVKHDSEVRRNRQGSEELKERQNVHISYKGSSRSAEFHKPRPRREYRDKSRKHLQNSDKSDSRVVDDKSDHHSPINNHSAKSRYGHQRPRDHAYSKNHSKNQIDHSPRERDLSNEHISEATRDHALEESDERPRSQQSTQIRKVQTWPRKSFQDDVEGNTEKKEMTHKNWRSNGQGHRYYEGRRSHRGRHDHKKGRGHVANSSSHTSDSDKPKIITAESKESIPIVPVLKDVKAPPGIKVSRPPPGFNLESLLTSQNILPQDHNVPR